MSFLALRSSHRPLRLLEEPTLITNAADTITSTSVNGNGNLVNLGGSAVTEKGFVYSTTAQPTTASSKVIISGVSTGTYSGSISSLSASTTYHYRAYAINALGTGYGDDVMFTTSAVSVISSRRMLMGVGR